MSQKELASRVLKEDGTAISAQYLNDIERGRRNPPSDHLIESIAKALDVQPDYLFYLAGQFPPQDRDRSRSSKTVEDALVAFRKALDQSDGARR